MPPKRQRLLILLGAGTCLGLSLFLFLRAFSDSMVFFVTPAQLASMPMGKPLRLGGMVAASSVTSELRDGHPVNRFTITDGQKAQKVVFQGLLPDLFREGQSVIALGKLNPTDHLFHASQVLAKHDETYMPREVAEALQKSGRWDPRFGPPPDPSQWQDMISGQSRKTHP